MRGAVVGLRLGLLDDDVGETELWVDCADVGAGPNSHWIHVERALHCTGLQILYKHTFDDLSNFTNRRGHEGGQTGSGTSYS